MLIDPGENAAVFYSQQFIQSMVSLPRHFIQHMVNFLESWVSVSLLARGQPCSAYDRHTTLENSFCLQPRQVCLRQFQQRAIDLSVVLAQQRCWLNLDWRVRQLYRTARHREDAPGRMFDGSDHATGFEVLVSQDVPAVEDCTARYPSLA